MRALVLACGAALATEPVNCGPSFQEEGQAVLLVAPLVMLAAMGVQWLVLAPWRRRWRSLELRWRPGLAVVAVLGAASVATALFAPRAKEWAPIAFWLFGCSYAAVLLVVTRVWLHFDRARVFALPHLVPLVAQVGLAGMAATGEFGALRHLDEWVWILPGFGGWAAGPIFVVLLAEAWLRNRRRPLDPAAGR
jgi:hypothetical protein